MVSSNDVTVNVGRVPANVSQEVSYQVDIRATRPLGIPKRYIANSDDRAKVFKKRRALFPKTSFS